MVKQGSAKPLYAGSIPAQASGAHSEKFARVAEPAYAEDLKSLTRKGLWVRIPPRAQCYTKKMNDPLIFRADPAVIKQGKILQLGAIWTTLYPRPHIGQQPFGKLAKNVDERIVFEGDQVSVYEDHFKQKHGVVFREIYFKDITGVDVLRTPDKKILYITIDGGGEKVLLVGLEKMADLLKSITRHIKQEFIKESIFDGKAAVHAGFGPFILLLAALAIVLLIFIALGWIK